MIRDAAVRAALKEQLLTVVAEPLLAQENVQFSPPEGKPWVRETLLPGIPQRAEIMHDGMWRQAGVYQIDVFTPSSIGTGVADSMAAAISEAFEAGQEYTSDDVAVRVVRVYALAGRESGEFYHKPVVIDWWNMGRGQ